ncbi:MAG: hybrid sensor histidine kinase/response regulator [Burkholderiales bacterium]
MAELSAAGAAIESGSVALPVEQDPVRLIHLRRQQLNLLALQATRSPFVIAIVSGVLAYIVSGYISIWRVALWGSTLIAVLFLRRAYALRQLRHPPADVQLALDNLVWFAFAAGVFTGLAGPLFFPGLPDVERALLTMILVCWTAGGVSTAAAYARAFYAYVGPALLPLAVLWVMTGNMQSIAVAMLIVLFGLMQVFFVRDNERVVRESFVMRYENERLLEALERERQEVLLARDRAEDANRAKSQFLAAASHDLRQPLHALSLFSATLTLRAVDGTTAEIAGHINKALASLSTLVDSLLDISKLDAGAVRPELQRVNVRALIERIEAEYRPVAREKGLSFRVAPADAHVDTDPLLLERVVRNLVDNAFKYTAAGSVSLDIELDEQTVRIAVRDTGTGIPKSERERIFEEFYQVGNPERDRGKGLGLGLAIVRRLARLLGLEVELESDPGRGSTFAVTLARLSGEIPPPQPPRLPELLDAGALAGAKVLVVDDEPSVRVGMRALLESWGCRVAACSGFVEAQRLLDDYALDLDVIIADFRLAQHENGIETVRRLRVRLGDVPALMVSGDTAPERLREAQASGLPFLHKPVSAEKLKETMLAVLRR